MADIGERFAAYVRDRGEHHLRVAVLLTGAAGGQDGFRRLLIRSGRRCHTVITEISRLYANLQVGT